MLKSAFVCIIHMQQALPEGLKWAWSFQEKFPFRTEAITLWLSTCLPCMKAPGATEEKKKKKEISFNSTATKKGELL